MVFDKQWFQKHNNTLCWFANQAILKYWFRRLLRIEKDIKWTDIVNQITPNSFTYNAKLKDDKIELTTDFRTHEKFGKRLYYGLKPLWYILHFWDWSTAVQPALNCGFDTLTVYPDADPGTDSICGRVRYSNANWTTCRNAADGSSAGYDFSTSLVAQAQYTTSYLITRGFFLYKTSALTSDAIISAGVLSLCSNGTAVENADTVDIDLVSSTPANNTTLSTADYDQIGSTVFASIANSSWVATDGTYNAFTLDASGRANISKTEISKFATRCSRDTDDSAPTGANSIVSYMSNQAGTTQDPKLVVTYTLPVVGPANLKTYNTNPLANIKTINTNAIANCKSLDTNV